MTLKGAIFLAFLMILPLFALAAPENDKDYSKQVRSTELEVSQKLGAPVEQTIIDRSDGEVVQRDRIGDGQVKMFMEHRKYDRIQDGDDVIGLEFQLFRL